MSEIAKALELLETAVSEVAKTPQLLETATDAILRDPFSIEAVAYGAMFVTFSGYLLYIGSICIGKTTPSRATWIIWTVLLILAAWSYDVAGAELTRFAAWANAFGALTVLLFSLWRGEGGIEKLDLAMLAGAVAGIFIWKITDSALLGLVTFLLSDFLGAVPTVKKVWKHPKKEHWFPWSITIAGNVLFVLALDLSLFWEWTFSDAVYPLYLLGINGLIFFLIVRRPRTSFSTPEGR